jgi:O-antigen biosynthesis protein
LDECLQAVSRQDYPSFDVLVVDNAPGEQYAREVAARWHARYLLEPTVGLSRARNRGAFACHTEVVAFLDDDAIPDPEWLSGLAREFDDDQVVAVAGRILPLSLETEIEQLFAVVGAFGHSGEQPLRIDRHAPFWFERANFGGIGDGLNMAFRRSVFDSWPGFDERLGRGAPVAGGEEHYAFFKLIDCGYRVVYTPEAVVRHPCPRTWKELETRYLKILTSTTGYCALLLVEEPRYRRMTWKYLVGALKGTKRTWRAPSDGFYPRIVPRWRVLLACLSGPLLYARSCFVRGSKPSLKAQAANRNSLPENQGASPAMRK